jgi:hypothetical protein
MAAGTAQGDWLLLLAMRAGTATMHIADSALMGWALVSAWRERRFLRLALVYGAIILVHGAWNFLALAYGLTILPTALEGVPINIGLTATYALPGLLTLAGFMLGVLVFMNRRLRRVPYSVHAVTRNEGLPPDSRL